MRLLILTFGTFVLLTAGFFQGGLSEGASEKTPDRKTPLWRGGPPEWAASPGKTPSHMEKYKNPMGCAGCHGGKGEGGSFLKKGSLEVCLECHGFDKAGKKGEAKTDIESLFSKPSSHPILTTSGYHRPYEVLPDESSLAPRHVTCVDCHSAHLVMSGYPAGAVEGYSPLRTRVSMAATEYEICYRCHSESANLPPGANNLIELFSPANPSYHPVEMSGKNNALPSLLPPLTANDQITCSDCHDNNDPMGPRGPHASEYPPILAREYRRQDGPEVEDAYSLCYGCHNRQSILGDESFQLHKQHIVSQETSCATCHSAHGSKEYPYLVLFNAEVVGSGKNGGPRFVSQQPGKPRCYLNCHGADHNFSGVGEKKWPW